MIKSFPVLLCIFVISPFSPGKKVSAFQELAQCGDWTPYKDEKCLKIATRAGSQTYLDAEVICESFKEELHYESYPRIITIKTIEEQKFIQEFLFYHNNVLDNVWLGIKENGSNLVWNDGSNIHFSNWVHLNGSNEKNRCVEIESGEGIAQAGLWVRVNCNKRNAVVCERTQTSSLETLQNMFLNYKLEQRFEMDALKESKRETEKQIGELEKTILDMERRNAAADQKIEGIGQGNAAAEQKITSLGQRNAASESEINWLKQNPVPVGFIYVQLANQAPPTTLWPQTRWSDVSTAYAGLFFRVNGGNAAPLGQIQEESTSRLQYVEHLFAPSGQLNCASGLHVVPSDGSWTPIIYTGRDAGGYDVCMRFHLSAAEVRPRNQAIIVWQRSG